MQPATNWNSSLHVFYSLSVWVSGCPCSHGTGSECVLAATGGRILPVLRRDHFTSYYWIFYWILSDGDCQTHLAPLPIKAFFNLFFKRKEPLLFFKQVVILRNLCFSFDMSEAEWHINDPENLAPRWDRAISKPGVLSMPNTESLRRNSKKKKPISDFNYSLLQEISGWMGMKLWLGHSTAHPCLGREALGEHFQDICLLGWVRGLQGWGALH